MLTIQDLTYDVVLAVADPNVGARAYVDIQDTDGTPSVYWREEDTVAAQPSAASTLSLSSSSTSDTSTVVRIWGVSSGENVTEIVTLSGTTPVATSFSYTRIDRVSKDSTTVGIVTMTSNAAAVTVATMAPREVAPRYQKLHLVPRPSSALVYTISYKAKMLRLELDQDIPVLPCQQAMINGAYSDALKEQRQFQKAVVQEQKYEDLIEWLLGTIERQGEFLQRMTPHVEDRFDDRPF